MNICVGSHWCCQYLEPGTVSNFNKVRPLQSPSCPTISTCATFLSSCRASSASEVKQLLVLLSALLYATAQTVRRPRLPCSSPLANRPRWLYM
jgi:hypothetical protein